MTWVLVVTWITAAAGGGIDITKWPTLGECYEAGKRAQSEFSAIDERNIANFSCMPSHGGEPTCDLDDKDACK